MHPRAQLRGSTSVLHCSRAFSHPWVPRGPGYLPSMASTACCFPPCTISHHLPSSSSLTMCSLQLCAISHLQLFPIFSHIPSPVTSHLVLYPIICFLHLGVISHHVPFPIACHAPSPAIPIACHLPSCPISHLVPCLTPCHHLHLPRTSQRCTHSPVSLPPPSPSQTHSVLEKLMGNKQQTPNHVQTDATPHWKFQPGGQADHKKPMHPFPLPAFPSW